MHAFQNLHAQRSYLDTRDTEQVLKSIILYSTKAGFTFRSVSLCVLTYLNLCVDQGCIRCEIYGLLEVLSLRVYKTSAGIREKISLFFALSEYRASLTKDT